MNQVDDQFWQQCDNCEDGTGWLFDKVYGWVGCADCNDNLDKPKPTWKSVVQSIN